LIFASNAVDMAAMGMAVTAQVNILAAILFLALVLAPLPAAAALKMSIQ
jgi:heme exporter protein B